MIYILLLLYFFYLVALIKLWPLLRQFRTLVKQNIHFHSKVNAFLCSNYSFYFSIFQKKSVQNPVRCQTSGNRANTDLIFKKFVSFSVSFNCFFFILFYTWKWKIKMRELIVNSILFYNTWLFRYRYKHMFMLLIISKRRISSNSKEKINKNTCQGNLLLYSLTLIQIE